MKALAHDIQKLKREKNAVILAHYYEEGDIQDIADHVGDSLFLAQMGQKCEAPVVLLAGVYFMAESVKILSRIKPSSYPTSLPAAPWLITRPLRNTFIGASSTRTEFV